MTQGLLLRRGTPQGVPHPQGVPPGGEGPLAAAGDSDMGGGGAERGAGMRLRPRGGRVSEAEAAAAAAAAAATVAAATGGDRGQITRVLLQRMMSDRRRRRSSMPTQVWLDGLPCMHCQDVVLSAAHAESMLLCKHRAYMCDMRTTNTSVCTCVWTVVLVCANRID